MNLKPEEKSLTRTISNSHEKLIGISKSKLVEVQFEDDSKPEGAIADQ